MVERNLGVDPRVVQCEALPLVIDDLQRKKKSKKKKRAGRHKARAVDCGAGGSARELFKIRLVGGSNERRVFLCFEMDEDGVYSYSDVSKLKVVHSFKIAEL